MNVPLHQRELVFGYYDPGRVHLRQRGKAETFCGQRALDKPLTLGAVTCEWCAAAAVKLGGEAVSEQVSLLELDVEAVVTRRDEFFWDLELLGRGLDVTLRGLQRHHLSLLAELFVKLGEKP